MPHQVFTLSLEDAAQARVVEAARPSGWRYLLEVDERVVASAETRLTDGEVHVFSLVNDGPFVRGTTEALPLAEDFGQQRDIDLDLRLLNVPAVYLMALWLEPQRTTDREARAFIPIAPAPPGMEVNRVYGDEEFTSRLRALAEAVPLLSADDARGGR